MIYLGFFVFHFGKLLQYGLIGRFCHQVWSISQA